MTNDEGVVTEVFIKSHPDEAAAVIERFPLHDVLPFFESLPTELGSTLLIRISPSSALEFLLGMEPKLAGGLLSAMPLARAAMLVRRLEGAKRDAILVVLSKKKAKALNRLLSYPENCAGSLMDPDIPALPSDVTVGAARELLRHDSRMPSDAVCVVNRDQRLLGFLDLAALVLAESEHSVQSVTRRDPVGISPYTGTYSLERNPVWRDYDVLPLVDDSGVFLGIVRHRDLRRIKAHPPQVQRTGTGLDTILPLGEIYWLGLWDVFQSIASSKPQDSNQGAIARD